MPDAVGEALEGFAAPITAHFGEPFDLALGLEAEPLAGVVKPLRGAMQQELLLPDEDGGGGLQARKKRGGGFLLVVDDEVDLVLVRQQEYVSADAGLGVEQNGIDGGRRKSHFFVVVGSAQIRDGHDKKTVFYADSSPKRMEGEGIWSIIHV